MSTSSTRRSAKGSSSGNRRNGGAPSDEPSGIDASIWGISDTELLAVVDDLADENGWTSTLAVRAQLGENVEEAGHHTGIPGRLAWMAQGSHGGRSYGWLERHPDERGMWRLTAMGHAILDGGDLSASFQRSLDKLNAAQRVQLTREVSTGGAHSAREIQVALRREWQRNLGRRS